MNIILDSSPKEIERIKQTKLTAFEEIYTLINHKESTAIIFDFERRYLESRCIVKEIDYSKKIIKEKRSRTLRFKVKSTFAPRPESNEALTFQGGGFTASVVRKENTYRLIAAIPTMENTDNIRGLKLDVIFVNKSDTISFNSIYTKNKSSEAESSSILSISSGSIVKGGIKQKIENSDYTLIRTWKMSSFPVKRNTYYSFIYGKEDEAFSIFFSFDERKCFLLKKGSLTEYPLKETRKISESEYLFIGDEKTVIHVSFFAFTKERSGPFRKNRTINYGVASGRLDSFSFSSAISSIEI